MASLVEQSTIAPLIDHALDYLTRQWLAVPEVVSTWETWDELDRLDFVLEWPLRESRLNQLRRWRDEGHLSTRQLQRFATLERLIRRHRAAVDCLLAE